MNYSKYMDIISSFLTVNLDKFLIAILIISVIMLIALTFVISKLGGVMKKIRNLTAGMEGKNIEEIMMAYGNQARRLNEDMEEFRQRIEKMERENAISIKKVYSKRYRAFDDIGSDLSFSVAFLNDSNDGMLITSIYGRDENRVYLKPIQNGVSAYPLSPEESEVIKKTTAIKS